jgi:putative tryptophan/tyrosine transport system substrate-binding protein
MFIRNNSVGVPVRRRKFIGGVCAAAAFCAPCCVSWPPDAYAQSSPRPILRLAWVWLGAPATDDSALKGLQKGLQELGYVEGRNLKLDRLYAYGSEERLDALLAGVVKQRETDILLSSGTVVTRAAKKATATMPIVSLTGDPIRAGIVTSIAHPGGNITGVTLSAGTAIGEKWVEVMHEAFPQVSRIAVVWNPSSDFSVAVVRNLEEAARHLGLTAISHEVRESAGFARAFAAITNEKAEAIVGDTDPLIVAHSADIAAFATKSRLPGVYGVRDVVDAGGLMSYGASVFEVWRTAASHVDRIAKGANPGDLPIQQPTKFTLVVNLRAAKAIGVTLPNSIVLRADEVIE